MSNISYIIRTYHGLLAKQHLEDWEITERLQKRVSKRITAQIIREHFDNVYKMDSFKLVIYSATPHLTPRQEELLNNIDPEAFIIK